MPPSWSRGPVRFPFAAYEIVFPDEPDGETWVGAVGASGVRLSRVRNVATGRWVRLHAMCLTRGCKKASRATCNHHLYWHVRLTLGAWGRYPAPAKQKQHYVQYSRLMLFASQGLPCDPAGVEDYIVHHEQYVTMRVGLQRPRSVADDSDLDLLKWETRKEHGHEHFGVSSKKRPAASDSRTVKKKPAATPTPP